MSNHETEGPLPAKEKNLTATLDHAKTGYQNAQDIIKFIDTKTGAVTGLCTLAIGGVLGLVTWFFGLEEGCRLLVLNIFHPCVAAIVLLGLSPIAGAGSLVFSLLSLIARSPLTSGQTVLFPCLKKTGGEWDGISQSYKNKIVAGMTATEIRDEYHDQILNVGIIVQKKIARHRWAVGFLMLQLGLLAAAASVLCFGMGVRSAAIQPGATVCVAPVSSGPDIPLPPPASREPSSPTNLATR